MHVLLLLLVLFQSPVNLPETVPAKEVSTGRLVNGMYEHIWVCPANYDLNPPPVGKGPMYPRTCQLRHPKPATKDSNVAH